VPRYDFRCDHCGSLFELSRPFSQSDAPAACPRDGARATRLFSPPLDVLVYGREPIVDTRRPTIPPGALSCHDHGPAVGAAATGAGDAGRESGSRWHAHGYEGKSGEDALAQGQGQGQGHGHGHTHGHSHAHGHSHGHPHHHH
jgi:putative FmdB family regulatory protein